jgi:Putative beta-barrel porin 2
VIISQSKKHRTLAASLLLPAIVTTSYGFAEIARGSLLLQTSGSVTYDSYFIGTTENSPDTIYSLYPSLRYSRSAGVGTISASTGVAFNRYDENSDLDSDDIRASLAVTLPTVEGARLDGSVGLDYNEATVVDLQLNDRVATQTRSAAVIFNYRLADRVSLSESLSYANSTRDLYSDQELFTNRLSVSYKGFLRGTSLIGSHAMAMTKTSGDNFTGGRGLDQQSHNFSLGLSRPIYGDVSGSISYGVNILKRSAGETTRGDDSTSSGYLSASIDGPFLPRNRFPKLTSSASFTYSQSSTAGFNDDGGKFLSGSLSLAWSARERTKLQVRATRSLDLTINDLSSENTRISGGFSQQIGRSTSLSGEAGHSWSTIRGIDREDTILDASLSLSRTFNKYLSANLGYTYQIVDTSASGIQPGRYAPRDYDRHTATISATVTF